MPKWFTTTTKWKYINLDFGDYIFQNTETTMGEENKPGKL